MVKLYCNYMLKVMIIFFSFSWQLLVAEENQHTFVVVAGLDARGWVGPRVTGSDTLFGLNGKRGDLVGGANLVATYLGFDYMYGPYAGAAVHFNLEGVMINFAMNSPREIGVGIRRAYGWVDPLGLSEINQYVGTMLSVGLLHFEPFEGLNAPSWQGGPATAFEMGTSAVMTRAFQLDPLAWRLDLPINALEVFDLNLATVSDLDFSRNNYGWSILGEVTATEIHFNSTVKMGVNAHYHHWQAGDERLALGQEHAPPEGGSMPEGFRGGEGIYGSHLVGASFNVEFKLADNARIIVGALGDYQWYFGHYLLTRYQENFDMNLEDGIINTYFGERKGSLQYEVGVHFYYPAIVTLNVAYVSRVLGNFGFSVDEGKVGRQANTFISLRMDWHFFEERLKMIPYMGVSVGIEEARSGFWHQVGRVGYEVGLRYEPVTKINIYSGWHAGSSFLGAIEDPGLVKSRKGHFYLRFAWSMNS